MAEKKVANKAKVSASKIKKATKNPAPQGKLSKLFGKFIGQ